MAAALSQKSTFSASARVQSRKAGFVRPVVRRAVVVKASAQQSNRAAVMQAVVLTSTAAFLASPLAAQAAVTPSLKNFLLSLVAGATVLTAIAGGITLVSTFDPVNRG